MTPHRLLWGTNYSLLQLLPCKSAEQECSSSDVEAIGEGEVTALCSSAILTIQEHIGMPLVPEHTCKVGNAMCCLQLLQQQLPML